MLHGETIIYFGPEPWDGLWRNRHQLMSRFARENNVWYVEPPTLIRRWFSAKKHRTRLYSRDKSGVNIFHSPWWLPIVGRAPFKKLSIGIYLWILSRLAGLGRQKPIVWLSRPNMLDYCAGLNTKLSIYHVVDEYSGYGTPSKSQQQRLMDTEAHLLRYVDLAIVVTKSLYALKVQHNANTHLVPNAVDYDAYAHADTEMPTDIAGIPQPIIGYSGLIAARLDLDLLLEAARKKPDWSFVFVGTVNALDCEKRIALLQQQDNVYFLGQKPVAEMPNYVAQFDVSTIPYLDNLRAQHANPLKLYEYAAASTPIVTTDFAAAREFGGHLEIAHTATEFIKACERCLALEADANIIVENRCFAAANTWENRVEQISEIVTSRA